MDYLREGIHLRGFAQIEPLVAYKNEAFTLFEDLMNSVWTDFARLVFHVEVQHDAPNGGGGVAAPSRSYQPGGSSTGAAARVSYSSGVAAGAGALAAAAGAEDLEEPLDAGHVEQRRVSTDEQLGRNDPCWCGSGKKFKRCHGA
jgi:preprotein translocase subunit SecA